MQSEKSIHRLLFDLGITKFLLHDHGPSSEILCKSEITLEGMGYYQLKHLYVYGQASLNENGTWIGTLWLGTFNPRRIQLLHSGKDNAVYRPIDEAYSKIRPYLEGLQDPVFDEVEGNNVTLYYLNSKILVVLVSHHDRNRNIFTQDYVLLPPEAFYFNPDLIALFCPFPILNHQPMIMLRGVEEDSSGTTKPSKKMESFLRWFKSANTLLC